MSLLQDMLKGAVQGAKPKRRRRRRSGYSAHAAGDKIGRAAGNALAGVLKNLFKR